MNIGWTGILLMVNSGNSCDLSVSKLEFPALSTEWTLLSQKWREGASIAFPSNIFI